MSNTTQTKKCPKCKEVLTEKNGKYICPSCGTKFRIEKQTTTKTGSKTEKTRIKGIAEKIQKDEKIDGEHNALFKNLGIESRNEAIAGVIIAAGALILIGLSIATPALAKGLTISKITELENTAEVPETEEVPKDEEETTQEIEQEKNIPEEEESHTEPTEPLKQESTDGRVHYLIDISEKAVDNMVIYTTNDLKARLAVTEDALNLVGDMLDSRYSTLIPKSEETKAHPMTWWIAPEKTDDEELPNEKAEIEYTTIMARDTYLIQDNESIPDKGTLKILYEVRFATLFPYEMMPGDSNTIEDSFYVSYSYPVDLSNKEAFITDYANFEFDGKNNIDINKENWELKHIKLAEGAILLDEEVPARG